MKTMLLYDYLNFGNQMDLAHQLNMNVLDYDLFETVISQYQYYNYFGNVFEDINWNHSNQDEMLDLFGKIYFMICGFRINVNITQQENLNEIYSQRLDDFFFSRMNFVLDKLQHLKQEENQDQIQKLAKLLNEIYFAKEVNVIQNFFMKTHANKDNNSCKYFTVAYLLEGKKLNYPAHASIDKSL